MDDRERQIADLQRYLDEWRRGWQRQHREQILKARAPADLRGADLDFSCWPLWCGSLAVKVCKRIAVQLAYHFCRLDCDDPEYIAARNAILDFANQFHRVDECGKLEKR